MSNDEWLFNMDQLFATESRSQTRSPEERVHLYISTDRPSIRASRFGPNHPENNPYSRARSAAPERPSSNGPDRTRARDGLERIRREPRSTPADALFTSGRRRAWPNRAHEPLGELPRHTYRRAPSYRDSVPDGPEPNEANEVMEAAREFPPLRRMGRRQVTDGFLPSSSLRQSWSPSGAIDGLGDRERSLSPPTDPWETMLTTIAPDTQLPSADSSFTSAAVSASFSASNANSQAGSDSTRASPSTHITIPSRRQSPDETSSLLPQRACDTDDDMSANDTESDDRLNTRSNARRHRTYTSGYRPRLQDGPPRRNPEAYSSSVRSRSREATAFIRDFYATAEEEERALELAATRPPQYELSVDGMPPQLPQFPRLRREHSSSAERNVENNSGRRDSGVAGAGSNSDDNITNTNSDSSDAVMARLFAHMNSNEDAERAGRARVVQAIADRPPLPMLQEAIEETTADGESSTAEMREAMLRLARRVGREEEFWRRFDGLEGVWTAAAEDQQQQRQRRERGRL